mgnify:FL=1
MEKKTIIFDLDGTLALVDKRVEKSLIPTESSSDGEGMNWDIFFDGQNVLTLDEPNYPVISMAQMYYEKGFNIVIFSGRNDRSYEETQQWLEEYEVPYNLLVMRPDKFKDKSWPIASGNPATKAMRFMPDEILKKEMLDTFVDIDDVFMCVDDRQKVVDMWRENGLTCFQVAPGDFK